MKGKSNFTKSECAILKRLIKRKVNSNKSEQKNIRNEMRDMNFYISDFTDKKGFDVDDFSQLIEDGKIKCSNALGFRFEVNAFAGGGFINRLGLGSQANFSNNIEAYDIRVLTS